MDLPGGEMLIQDQDEVIEMLEKLRDRKEYVPPISTIILCSLHHCRAQLAQFSARALVSIGPSVTENRMEIDSMASTPFHD